ncbi:ectoine synthase [uncultured Roseobacter sp.]|uniref:ectoine synthase n=1 Tax=uncultured Roseobacter sp. TaxID=114847 RepID=UPI0026286709|nr:ectoine synthase [uncultured Roseobacter sp.]
MIVTRKSELEGTARDASGPGWTSLRLLVKSDGMGFSMTDTQVMPGEVLSLQYKHHIEACYCIGGTGQVTELDTGAVHEIGPGVLYAPNEHERHQVEALGPEPLHFICVFSPALQGDEVHGPDGSYASS